MTEKATSTTGIDRIVSRCDWIGVDPYDALLGSAIPEILRASPRSRQLLVQLRKRFPLDLGPLLRIRPFAMAKALGCFLAFVARAALPEPTDEDLRRACEILKALHLSGGASGAGGWGYEFDVQTRWSFYPAGSPNLIATVFVARGLLEAGLVFSREDWLAQAYESARFIRETLAARIDGALVFRYTPDTRRLIHNANLLGAGLVAATAALAGDRGGLRLAADAAAVSLAALDRHGLWPYGDGDLRWCDNFHTAYDLDGLSWVAAATNGPALREGLSRAVEGWARSFFDEDGAPRYYPERSFPHDIHSAATAVDVAARLSILGHDTLPIAERVGAWTERNLIDPRTGRTWFQQHRFFTDRRTFLRWGDAHWALALGARRALATSGTTPVESALLGLPSQ